MECDQCSTCGVDAMMRQRRMVRTVGTCDYCEDPIYNFQAVKDGMHAGCAALLGSLGGNHHMKGERCGQTDQASQTH